jgi:hypothetical protein
MPIEATQALVLVPPPAALPPPLLLLPLLPQAATDRTPSAAAAITTVPFIEGPFISIRNFAPQISAGQHAGDAALGPGVILQENSKPPRSAECALIKPLRRLPGKRRVLIFERES